MAGRVALVTGARQGVGRSIATALAEAGAEVIGTSREAGDGLRALDVADPQQIDALMAEIGRLDILVNNAGLSIRRPAGEYAVDEWDAVLDVNLRGPFLMARAAAARMPGGGRIINLSSTYARATVTERAPYAASKAGLEHLTRVLALEWAPRGILVNAVAPGLTDTETRAAVLADPEQAARRAAEIPLGRIGEADDVAGAVLLLASEAGRFITGQTIVVDGGYTL
ncbi:SDR family oxidoreductase [Solirubrobacter ginsenosidimutans]|uniref:SDR family oxidoreductase n=1 Tax=Solirubrobacter ginsenosidimutans TaxID=490573 RepID=A0A9X3MQ78_9ACTN|nr:SDR family oxidoreductase [Solirubrobacter ginsenosidimutans]MDA0159243.1 SDR family oxidoreductase [Solirubrobacter ginsenosidimutans]